MNFNDFKLDDLKFTEKHIHNDYYTIIGVEEKVCQNLNFEIII